MAANFKGPSDVSAAKEKVEQTITTKFGEIASRFLANVMKKLDEFTLIMRIECENGIHTAWITGIGAIDPALAQGPRMIVMQALEQEHEGELLQKETCARVILPFLQIGSPSTTKNVSAIAYGSMVPGIIKALDPRLSAKLKSATFSVSVVNNYKRVPGAYKILLRNFTCSRNFRGDKERFGIVAMKHVQEQGICVPLSDVDQEDLECQLEEGDIEEILQKGLHLRQEAQRKVVVAQREKEQREAAQVAFAREQAEIQAKREADAKVQAALTNMQLNSQSVWDRQKPPGWRPRQQIRTSALYEAGSMSPAPPLPQSRSTGTKRKAGGAVLSTEPTKKVKTNIASAPTLTTALVPFEPAVPTAVPIAKNLIAGPSYNDHILALWWDRKHVELRRIEEAGARQAAELICLPIVNIDVERTGTRPLISTEVISAEGCPSARMTLFFKNYRWDSVELYYTNAAAAAVNVHYIMDRVQWLTSDEALITVGAPAKTKGEIKAEAQLEEVAKPNGKGKSKKKQQEQQLQQFSTPPVSESGSPAPEQNVAHCPECKVIFSEASYLMQCYEQDKRKWNGVSREKLGQFLKKLKFTQLGRSSRAVAAMKHIILQWLNEHDFDKGANDLWLDYKNSAIYNPAQLLALGTRKAQPGVTPWGMAFAVQAYEMKLSQLRSLEPGTKIEF